MTALAQTNVQLFNQLAEAGYAQPEIEAVRDAYGLALHLVSGQYRPTGKTFVAHLVGTASALAEIRAPIHVVVAGLLHSAYTHGDFGTLRRRLNAAKRRRVRSVIGEAAESLVAAYAAAPWDEPAVRALLDADRTFGGEQRDVLLMRLANEADDYGDRAALHSFDWEWHVAAASTLLPMCVELAMALGATELAARIERAAAGTLAVGHPLPRAFSASHSLLVAPASLRPRAHVRLRAVANLVRDAAGALSSPRR